MNTTGEASIEISAPASDVYALISDISRMGEWSPECYRTEVHQSAVTPAVGATFQGYNRNGAAWWNVPCKIVAAEPGRLFEFEAPTGEDGASRWTFQLDARGETTLVTERFNAPMLAMPETPAGQIPQRRESLIAGVKTTLARIKAAAESGPDA